MRKIVLLLIAVLLAGLTLAYYPRQVERPVKDGSGPLAVYIAAQYTAPEYHNPLEYWKTHHMDVMNRGDLAQSDCLYCHVPERSCNNCHRYVGANEIIP